MDSQRNFLGVVDYSKICFRISNVTALTSKAKPNKQLWDSVNQMFRHFLPLIHQTLQQEVIENYFKVYLIALRTVLCAHYWKQAVKPKATIYYITYTYCKALTSNVPECQLDAWHGYKYVTDACLSVCLSVWLSLSLLGRQYFTPLPSKWHFL